MKLEEGRYLTQCFSGHVLEVVPGGELEERCAKHAAEGTIDALILDSSECVECIEYMRERDREMNRMIDLLGCHLLVWTAATIRALVGLRRKSPTVTTMLSCVVYCLKKGCSSCLCV